MQKKAVQFIILCIALIFSCLQARAQTQDKKKLLKAVQKHYNAGEYNEALNAYEQLVKLKPDNFDYTYELALIYFHELNEKDQSIPFFKKAEQLMEKDSIPELYFLMAQAFQAEGLYEKAIETFHYYRDIDSNFLKVNVRRYVEQCNYGIELLNNPDPSIELVNIGYPVNSKYNEYAALRIQAEKDLVFTAKNVTNMFGELIEAIYVSSYASGEYEKPVSIKDLEMYKNLVVDAEEHSSIVNITPDGKRLFIYANSLLYQSNKEDGVWTEPVKLNDKINFNFSNRHCSFTADGKTVYFSSFDRKDQNNIEIYYANMNEDGSWTDALELGSPVNTRKNDDSPEISAGGDTLYFASNGHKGMGGYDIFMTVKNDSTWLEPVNMGTPVNSPWDDIYYKFNTNKKEGFVSSNRKGGMGEMDIYLIKEKP